MSTFALLALSKYDSSGRLLVYSSTRLCKIEFNLPHRWYKKIAFGARTKSYQVWQNADYDLQRKRANLDKAKAQGKTRQDRLTQMQQEITEVRGEERGSVIG